MISASSSRAQQVLQNNFYNQNPLVFNPAAAGIGGDISAFLNYRDQWSGLKGAPESVVLGVHARVTRAMGLGLTISQHQEGVFKQFSTDLNYSYRINLAAEQSLAFGLSIGMSQNSLDMAGLKVSNDSDPTIFSNKFNETLFESGVGLHYSWNNLNIQLSSPLAYGSQEHSYFQTIFGFGSYDFFLENELWRVQPSVFYRYTALGQYNQIDVNVLVEWDEKLWGQVGYRTTGSMIFGGGLKFMNMGLGYMYETDGSELSLVTSGSHEIMVYFESGVSKTKKKSLYRNSKRRGAWSQ